LSNKKTDRTKDIRTAAIISSVGNAVLAFLKITAGLLSGSGALVADGIDSSGDVLISVITLMVAKIITLPADRNHPWGHRRAETVATAFLAFALFFMGAQLIFNSAAGFFSGEAQAVPTALAFVVTIISIAGKTLLAFSQYILGKRAGSKMIKANAKNMASDVFVSFGVLAGLIISALTGTSYADTVFATLIGVWIIKTAIGIFLEANLELMDGNSNHEPYRIIVEAVNGVEGALTPHRARIRNIAGFWDITFDIDVDPARTVADAHAIVSAVESGIKARLSNVYDIMIHVEPRGDDAVETFGLSEDAMRDGPGK